MRTRSRRTGQSSSRSGAAREPPPPQQLLPDDIEKENAAILDKLPREVWEKITRWSGCFEFAMTCRYFRDLLQEHADAERKRRLEDAKTTTWYGRPERLSRKYGEYLETTLQSYTYIDTHDFGDCIYSATMFCFEDTSLDSADYMKWLFRETRSTYCREKALAAGNRWDGKPVYAVAQGEQNLMELAALRNDLDLIKWLRSQDPPCEWSKKACTAAAWANRWDLLRNLVSMGCPVDKGGMFGVVACKPQATTGWDPKTFSFERMFLPDSWDGKFEILKWLQRDHGCIFGEPRYQDDPMYFEVAEVVKASIENNDLECLQWVRAQGVTWGEIVYGPNQNGTFDGTVGLDILRLGQIFVNVDVCLFAAKMGHLKILQYAVEDGCPWVPEMCLEAAESRIRQDHVVDWITDGPGQSSSDSHDSEPESDSLTE